VNQTSQRERQGRQFTLCNLASNPRPIAVTCTLKTKAFLPRPLDRHAAIVRFKINPSTNIMSWTNVLAASELPEGARKVVKVADQKVLLIHHEGKIHAVANSCPHLKLPMKSGKINENGELVCPFHRSAFDLCTGKASTWTPFPPVLGNLMGMMSAEQDLPVFPAKVENGEICVDV
jgi:nitrite reductase/ring-hydroxylating ferredoxin subunit